MRSLSTLLIFIISVFLIGCGGSEVSGRSLKSANKSVSRIKDRLPTEKRIEFEVSYWTIRDSINNKDEFLDTVGGKSPDELIELGKEIFQQRKNAGFKKYQQYSNWDQMIAQFSQERIEQGRHRKIAPEKNNGSVLYRL